jgi:hypothetical protein
MSGGGATVNLADFWEFPDSLATWRNGWKRPALRLRKGLLMRNEALSTRLLVSKNVRISVGVAMVFALCQIASAATIPQLEWTRNLAADTYCYSVTSDVAGNAYVSGTNSLPGAFVAKYNATGNLVWQQQWGTGALNPLRMTSDGLGNIYIAGQYVPADYGRAYAMVTKFDAMGNFQWMQQLALAGTSDALSVAADALGNVFIGGRLGINLTPQGTYPTYDYNAYVARLDSAGNQQWVRTFGTSNTYDEVGGVAADQQGHVYFTGSTNGSLYGPKQPDYDAIAGEFDNSGNLIWAHQFGSAALDVGISVSVAPDQTVYVAGNTSGNLVSGANTYDFGGFVRKYDAAGNEIWTRQLDEETGFYGISTDDSGNAYFGGTMHIRTEDDQDDEQVLLGKYDSLGNLQWTKTYGTNINDEGWSVSVQPSIGAFIGGYTWNAHTPFERHGFVSKIVEIPEPTMIWFTIASGCAVTCLWLRRRSPCLRQS